MSIPRKKKGTDVSEVKDKVSLLQWEKKIITRTGGAISWVHSSPGSNNIGVNSTFSVDKTFGSMYYKCKTEKKGDS